MEFEETCAAAYRNARAASVLPKIVACGMYRYFIHFTGANDSYPNLEDVELTDDAAACDYAVQDARYLMREGLAKPGEWPFWRVEVVDETGRRLLVLAFSDLADAHGRVH